MSENKNWNCKISQNKNEGVFWFGWIAFILFIFFAIFLLFASFVSVIGIESIDLGARLEQYFNPATDPFVWVLISLLGISILLIIITMSVRSACTKAKGSKK